MHRKYWLWLVPLLLLTCWLGSRQLNIPIWFDEYVSIYNGGGPPYGPFSPAEILVRVRADDFQTPGHYLLLAGWSALVGWSPSAGRVLSLLCGLLAVAWIYRLGHDWVSPTAGIAAAITMGTSAFFANYMHEMRAYILYALLTAFTVWVYWRLISRKREPTFLLQAAFVMGIAGLFYTHYFASLTALMIGLYHLLFTPKNARWWRVFLLIILGGLLFLPWLGTVIEDLTMVSADPGKVRSLSLNTGTAIQQILYFFSNGSVALLALVAIYSLLHTNKKLVRLSWFWLLSVTGIALLVNIGTGALFSIRHLIGLWPALALLAGIGVDRLAKTGVRPVFVLGLWAIAGVWMTADPTAYGSIRQSFAHLHWDTLADALRSRVQGGDTILYLLPYPADPPLHEIVAHHYLQGLPGNYQMLMSPRLTGKQEFAQQADQLLTSAGRVYVGYDASQPPDYRYELDTALIKRHVFCGTVANTPSLHLNVYAPLPTSATPQFQFGEGLSLELLIPLPQTINQNMNVLLGQNLSSAINPSLYSAALHVENTTGELVAQTDYGLSPDANGCHSVDIPMNSLPPGKYQLRLIVYEWQTGKRLTGNNLQTGETSDRLLVGSFEVPE